MRSFTSVIRCAVDDRVAPRSEHPQQPVVAPMQDSALDQAAQGPFAYLIGALLDVFHPVAGVVVSVCRGNVGQHRIQQVVAGGRGVDQHQLVHVGVDARFEGKVHQHAAGERQVHGRTGLRRRNDRFRRPEGAT